MKRSTFLLIVALLGFLFGAMLLFAPAKAAENFGFPGGAQFELLFRTMGAMIFSAGLLNFMMRSNTDASAAAALLWTNIATHLIVMVIDLSAVAQGTLEIAKVAVGQAMHVFVILGSLIYLLRVKRVQA